MGPPSEGGTDVVVRCAVRACALRIHRTHEAAQGRGRDLRRIGEVVGSRTVGGRPGSVLDVPIRSQHWLARLITGLGADALVLEPAELRADVVARLRSVIDRTEVAL